PRGDRSLWPGRCRDWFRAEFRAAHRRPVLAGLGRSINPAQRPFRARAGLSRRQESRCGRHLVRRRGCRRRRRARDRPRAPRSQVLADHLSDAPARVPVVAGALAVGAVWIPKDSPTSHARVDVGGAVLSTVGLGGLGAGLTSLTNGSGLNLWVLVTLIV